MQAAAWGHTMGRRQACFPPVQSGEKTAAWGSGQARTPELGVYMFLSCSPTGFAGETTIEPVFGANQAPGKRWQRRPEESIIVRAWEAQKGC